MSWLVWWFQSNSSDTSGKLNPIEVHARAEGQSLPRYEISHAWFLIVYMLSFFLVDLRANITIISHRYAFLIKYTSVHGFD